MGWNKKRSECAERGYSVMEVMIASGILGFIAVALLPSVFALVDNSKVQAFRSVCSTLVRSKAQEYVTGVGASAAGAVVPSGFEYTKQRFRDNHGQCQATTTGASPGFRENVNSNTIIPDTGGQEAGLPANMKGYQQYVLLRHYNPRKIVAGSGNQPQRGCANANYQFFRAGDAIEVTVTGMIRTTGTAAAGGRDGRPFGKLQDNGGLPHPLLTCSTTQIIYPPRLPFRYYLGNDGKIRNYQATIAYSAAAPNATLEAMESHFRSVWSAVPSGGTVNSPVLANIRSFAIAPDNKSVYVLKPGVIELYASCTDQTVTVGGIAYPGVPDCSRTVGKSSWAIDGNIENIAVDFRDLTSEAVEETTPVTTDDRIFGLFNTGSTGGEIRQLQKGSGVGTWIANTAIEDSISLALPANRPRIRAMFISQNFPKVNKPSLFFVDNTCYTGGSTSPSGWVHCASIFNSGDVNMSEDVRELPLQVEGVSQ